MARTKVDQILQLKVTLAEVEPSVWRRLLVPADMPLAKLHHALQAAMGWSPESADEVASKKAGASTRREAPNRRHLGHVTGGRTARPRRGPAKERPRRAA